MNTHIRFVLIGEPNPHAAHKPRTHPDMFKRMFTHTLKHRHTLTHKHTHTHAQTHSHTNIHTHKHTLTHTMGEALPHFVIRPPCQPRKRYLTVADSQPATSQPGKRHPPLFIHTRIVFSSPDYSQAYPLLKYFLKRGLIPSPIKMDGKFLFPAIPNRKNSASKSATSKIKSLNGNRKQRA